MPGVSITLAELLEGPTIERVSNMRGDGAADAKSKTSLALRRAWRRLIGRERALTHVTVARGLTSRRPRASKSCWWRVFVDDGPCRCRDTESSGLSAR